MDSAGAPVAHSRRNSITSFTSNISTASSIVTNATATPRTTSTDDMINFDLRFIPKSRTKLFGLSRSNSVQSTQRSQSYVQVSRPNSQMLSLHPHRHSHSQLSQYQYQQQLTSASSHGRRQPYPPQGLPHHRPQMSLPGTKALTASTTSPGIFYFPNGEMFTPRQTRKHRQRPNKIVHQPGYHPVQGHHAHNGYPGLPQHHPNHPRSSQHMPNGPVPNMAPMRRNGPANTVAVPPTSFAPAPPTAVATPPAAAPNLVAATPVQNSGFGSSSGSGSASASSSTSTIHEKRPSSSSSMVSTSSLASSKLQQVSTLSSSTLSLSLLNFSLSPTPSQLPTEDTPLSSISLDDSVEKVMDTSMCTTTVVVPNAEKAGSNTKSAIIEEENEDEDEAKDDEGDITPVTIMEESSLSSQQKSTGQSTPSTSDPEPGTQLESHPAISIPTPIVLQRPLPLRALRSSPIPMVQSSSAINSAPSSSLAGPGALADKKSKSSPQISLKKKTSFGSFLKKIFGAGGDNENKNTSSKNSNKPANSSKTLQVKEAFNKDPSPVTQTFLQEETTDEGFQINFDEELKENESLLSFTVNDERDLNVGAMVSKRGRLEEKKASSESVNDNDMNDSSFDESFNYLDTKDEDFLLKLIEVGETTFPDLGNQDLGVTRRKSLKLQKNLTRNSTISSQNSNSSMMTFSSGYMEDIDRMIMKFQLDADEDDKVEDEKLKFLEIVRNNTIKVPKQNLLIKSALGSKDEVEDNSGTKKNVRFGNQLYLNNTYSASDYDRFNMLLKRQYQSLAMNPALIKEIRLELNNFKETMEIHELSRRHTQFFK